MSKTRHRIHGHGVTFIETLTVVAILGIVLAVGIPQLKDHLVFGRLVGNANLFAGLARQAHAMAAEKGKTLYLHVNEAGGSAEWCYGLSETATCDCTVNSSCTIDGVEQAYRNIAPGISIDPGVPQNVFSFQHKRNTVTAGNVLFTAGNGKQLYVKVSDFGRIRICSPTGVGNISSKPTC